MKSLIFGLAVAMSPWAAQAGEAVTYVVDGENFEGYRSAAKGETKGLVLIIHDWDGLTKYEAPRPSANAQSDRRWASRSAQRR